MTSLFIISGVLFLIILPIISLYVPFSEVIPDCEKEDFDLNPNKRKVGESTEEYKKRLEKIVIKKDDQITFKSLFRSIFIGVMVFIIISLFYFLNM